VDGERGIWHLAHGGAVSWFEFAAMAAASAGWDRARVVPCEVADLGFAAPRPAYSALGSRRASLLPPLERAVEDALGRRSLSGT
jgi:dTDP-4-dehydrorhamnose reductase